MAILTLRQWHTFLNTPLNMSNHAVEITVKQGMSVKQLAAKLVEKQLLTHPRLLSWLAMLTGQSGKIQTGEYAIEPGLLPSQFLHELVSGHVILHQVTLVEGWTYQQAEDALKKHEKIKFKHTTLPWLVGKASPEGLIYPETYDFPKGTPSRTLLELAHTKMKEILNKEWQDRADNLPYKTPYEALIVASLIEKETAIVNEKSKVAGVILRRIQKHIPLQIDASVIYGLGEQYKGYLTHADLKIKTPYNTYLQLGLPPTPIALVSQTSLHAALHPEDGDVLYYVSKGDGSHVFSKTLKQHQAAIRKYLIKGTHHEKKKRVHYL